MCGIFAYIGKNKNAAKIVFSALQDLEYRGYDSWGIAVEKDKNSFYIKKKIGKIGENNINYLPKSHLALGHTRWATHGNVTLENAHPHLDCSGKIIIVHNGIVENYEYLKSNLIKKGHRFVSETDSEIICHLIEDYNKKHNFPVSVKKAFLRLVGLNALIASRVSSQMIIAVRNGSPLVLGFNQEENYIASDALALFPHTKRAYFLKDNELAVVTQKKVSVTNVFTNKKQQLKATQLEYNQRQVAKDNFPHFMLKEIFEQPRIISNICSTSDLQIKNLSRKVSKAKDTYFIGCGSASFACLAAAYLFSKIADKHINWAVGSEFNYHLDYLTRKSLVIALSQSGETIDILEAIKYAKRKNAKIFALVNVLGSSLFREADYKMLIQAGPEKAVATTKAFTAKLSYLLILAHSLKDDIKTGKLILKKALKATKKLLKDESQKRIKKLARVIKNQKNVYIIGRGLSYPAALEIALKIKEISYIHAEGFAAGELKHGVIALIEKNTFCIAFLPNDETYDANLAGAMELKARGGKIIGLSYKKHQIFDYFIPIDDCQEATIIPNVVFGQLLAYFLATVKGLDPDKPRNLAKSVTVK